MADIAFPVETLAVPRMVRLVATARLRDPVLLGLVSSDRLDDLAEIEGATSGRLTGEAIGTPELDPREFVAGVSHARFINAAFAYWRPRALNRFNGPGRGAWYAAMDTETCIAEVAFHMTRELDNVNDHRAVVDYAEMFAGYAGATVDLLGVDPAPACLDPDPDIGYPAGNDLARAALRADLSGIRYPSVRHAGGLCLVALRPQAVQSVAQGDVVRLTWRGRREPDMTRP